MMEVVVTTGAIRRAKLQSNHYHQQTNTQKEGDITLQYIAIMSRWHREITRSVVCSLVA